jgi:hypothetical protein
VDVAEAASFAGGALEYENIPAQLHGFAGLSHAAFHGSVQGILQLLSLFIEVLRGSVLPPSAGLKGF